MDETNAIMELEGLVIGYHNKGDGRRKVAGPNCAGLHQGELVCLLGPNGSGKSTLIKTMAGMQSPLEGSVYLAGDDMIQFTPKEIARKLSTVLTDRILIGNLSVFTLVSLGRSPYTGWTGRLRTEDEEATLQAIQSTGLEPLAERDISTLSDGERQKTMIARALAQDTDTILLDEPTAHLDLPNRVEIIRLLRKLARETGKSILLSTHELDLALKAGDKVWMLNEGGELFTGVPEDLVLNGTFEAVFERDSFDFDRTTGSFNLHNVQDKTASLSGDATAVFWTKRALEREGYRITDNSPTRINCFEEKENYSWKVNDSSKVNSVKELVRMLNI